MWNGEGELPLRMEMARRYQQKENTDREGTEKKRWGEFLRKEGLHPILPAVKHHAGTCMRCELPREKTYANAEAHAKVPNDHTIWAGTRDGTDISY